MIDEFNDFPWHDSELIELTVNRENPGKRDEVVLLIRSRDGEVSRFTFTDCYAFECLMNFGVVAPETIRNGCCSNDSAELDRIRERWQGAGVDLGKLMCFEIVTNSTNSTIKIFAIDFSWRLVA